MKIKKFFVKLCEKKNFNLFNKFNIFKRINLANAF